jgi:hypothetical protein
MMTLAGVLNMSPHLLWDYRRLWSLADMINFRLHNFVVSQESFKTQLDFVSSRMMRVPHEQVSETEHKRIVPIVAMVAENCVEKLHLPEANNTVTELFNVMNSRHVTTLYMATVVFSF